MSDTVKLIIEIPKEVKQEFDKTESIALKGAYFDLDGIIGKAIQNGIPLDDVKAEIQRTITASWYNGENYKKNYRDGIDDALNIIDNIGKAESEE